MQDRNEIQAKKTATNAADRGVREGKASRRAARKATKPVEAEPRLADVMRVEHVPWNPDVDWVEFVARLLVTLYLADREREKQERAQTPPGKEAA